MRHILKTGLPALCFPAKIEPPGDTLVVVAKATLDLVPEAPATLAERQRDIVGSDQIFADTLGNSVRYGSDVELHKPCADLLLTGTCHPPDGGAVRCDVTFGVGRWQKTLAVFGDRFWLPSDDARSTLVSDPRPITRMPIRYELALGGADHPPNRHGRGLERERGRDGVSAWPVPNIEYPQRPIVRPEDRPPPAGFGPLGLLVPSRWKRRGTYDERWMHRRRPYPPEDVDWRCCNAAPADQRYDGYLAGDEPVTLVNLHGGHPVYRTRLPGVRARCFLHLAVAGRHHFFEVGLDIDTLWIDADAEQAVLVWRGHARLPQDRDETEDAVLFLHEEPGRPERTREEAWRMFRDETAPAQWEPPAAPEVTPAMQEKVDAYLAEARKALVDADAPEELLRLVEGETDPERFGKILVDWAERAIKPGP